MNPKINPRNKPAAPQMIDRCPSLRTLLMIIGIALLNTPSNTVSAQGGQTGGNQTGGGQAGGGQTGGGQTGGTGAPGLGGSEFFSADEAFVDGVQRAGAPEARGIGTGGPEVAGGAGGAGGGFGGGGFGGGLGGLGGFASLFGGGQTQETPRSIRTRLISGVDIAPQQPRVVSAIVNTRLSTLSSRARFVGVGVQMDGRTAILNGRVATAADKRMALLLVRLEPGVSKVEDRLVVETR